MSVHLRHAGLHGNIHPPQQSGDAGLDLVADEAFKLYPGVPVLVPTGVKVEIPLGYSGFVLPRSSFAKRGIVIPNSPGLIDSGYRGEIKVGLLNGTPDTTEIDRGDRIAQLVIIATPSVVLLPVNELSQSERGETGFGSTGK